MDNKYSEGLQDIEKLETRIKNNLRIKSRNDDDNVIELITISKMVRIYNQYSRKKIIRRFNHRRDPKNIWIKMFITYQEHL